jgi:hypothetical protein
MTNINWDDLIYSIKEKEAILLIGPQVLKNKKGEVLQNLLFEKLASEKAEMIYDYYEKEGLFLFKEEMYKGRFVREIKKFYKGVETPELVKQLIQIPFHVIINTTPNLMLKNAFELYGLEKDFHYFSHNEPATDIPPSTIEKPLIYNLFGSLEGNDESVILSHDDLFKYLQAILGKKSIPQGLKKLFEHANELIFLGFSFEKWYVQLILRIFELEKGKFAFNRIASGQKIENKVKELVFNQFKIKYIDDDIENFVKTLHQKCTESDEIELRKLNKAEKVAKKMEEIDSKEVKVLEEKIERLYKLLSEYELELDLAKDPTDKMRYEHKIENLKEKITEAKEEMKKLI